MEKINKKEKIRKYRIFWATFLIVGLVIMFSAYFSAMHSIDLSWNAVRIEGLIDDNGIVEQTPEEMYRHGYLYVSYFPSFLALYLCFAYGIVYRKLY